MQLSQQSTASPITQSPNKWTKTLFLRVGFNTLESLIKSLPSPESISRLSSLTNQELIQLPFQQEPKKVLNLNSTSPSSTSWTKANSWIFTDLWELSTNNSSRESPQMWSSQTLETTWPPSTGKRDRKLETNSKRHSTLSSRRHMLAALASCSSR